VRPIPSPDARRALALARSLAVVFLVVFVATRFFRLNVSPSVPVGLYRLTAVPPVLERGMLVLVPVPASMQPWISRWTPLLKPVAGVAGGVVTITDAELRVNGEPYGPVYQEAHGKTLPYIRGQAVVQQGTVFLASHAPQSIDGRYFGVTQISDLTARALPVWTWR
jgi:conjugative transfer signal peptidase TraF